jgi:hypothetical protein
MNKLLKAVLKTGMHLLEEFDGRAADMRDRVAGNINRAGDRVSDLREQASETLYGHEDHTVRNLMTFGAGLAVGVGAGILFAPASGEQIRDSIGEKVQDIGQRVRDRFSPEEEKVATGAKNT